MGESRGFGRLHVGVQRWVWAQNWTALRDIQERAIEPICAANCDVIISAATAAGKTEAAFLPACSRVAEMALKGMGILYLSPLKALINDQYRRLQDLGEILDLPITPWHGDVLQSAKNRQLKVPRGILLITPESLESLLLHRAGWCKQAFGVLSHVIVDEFHAFLGTERGCQLQSLLHRLEVLVQRIIPRIALSATFGDMQQVAHCLRPKGNLPCELITSTTSRSDLQIQLRGYRVPARQDEETPSTMEHITDDLYRILRGKSNLVFANSRGRTEELSVMLAERCEQEGVPNEFYPHHGNLSKEIRESLEVRLQEETLPTTAICTMTLELGIDIGSVDSIAQVTAPHSVASMRQRLGRSGRRGEPAVLRLFIPEIEITAKSHLLDRLRLETVQCVAMINLLLQKWCEPAPLRQYHLSTLVQQTLSVIGQYGGVRADQLWQLLCNDGPFPSVDQAFYAAFLRALGQKELITQTQDGQLTLGVGGERVVGHYSFYTAFHTPEEYRLECEGRILGAIPIDKPLVVGQHVIFAGKRWKVLGVDVERKLVMLNRASGGRPPQFEGGGQAVHDAVRQEMRRVYDQQETPVYLEKTAKSLLAEGMACFHDLQLSQRKVLQVGGTIYLLPWLGDRITTTLAVLLRKEGLTADCAGGIIEVSGSSLGDFSHVVGAILGGAKPTPTELAERVPDTIVEKHDHFLPKELRDVGYGARFFDIDGAWQWLVSLKEGTQTYSSE